MCETEFVYIQLLASGMVAPGFSGSLCALASQPGPPASQPASKPAKCVTSFLVVIPSASQPTSYFGVEARAVGLDKTSTYKLKFVLHGSWPFG